MIERAFFLCFHENCNHPREPRDRTRGVKIIDVSLNSVLSCDLPPGEHGTTLAPPAMNRFLASALLFSSCVACGSGVVQAPPKPPNVERSLFVPPAPEIVLEPGEQLVAGATVLGVSVGTLDMRLGTSCREKSENVFRVESSLGTAGVARWFSKTHGTSTTLLARDTLLPSESTTMVISGEDWRRYHIQFEPGAYHYYQTRSSGKNKEGREESPGNEPIYDTQSAYLLLRTWQPDPGEQSYFYVVLGKDLWRGDVVYRGKERIDTRDGPITARHLEGTAHRINLEPGDEYTPRKFALWLSDDERRIPVKVVGDGSLGSIHFDLTRRAILDPCARAQGQPDEGALVAGAEASPGPGMPADLPHNPAQVEPSAEAAAVPAALPETAPDDSESDGTE
jgi:hypothetical protein